jgi:DNA-binding transcriptional LysR family regulator
MDRFQEMRTFVAVVEAGSFVGGADALQLSKTATSRLVGELEARLGVRLLNRTTRKLSLTQEGEVFLDRCREALAVVGEAEAEITARAGEAVGRLRVNVPFSFGVLQLAPLWPLFMARHPKVDLEVALADRLVDLVDEGYDLAVRIARLPSSSLVSRRLATTRLVACASPEYLRRHGAPVHPDDLAQHAVLSYTLLAMGEQWEFTGPDGPFIAKVVPRMRSNSGDTCIAAALLHQGIVLQPTFLVGDALRSGALVELMPGWRSIELGLYAVYPSRKHVTPKVRVLIDFLVEGFRQPGWPE